MGHRSTSGVLVPGSDGFFMNSIGLMNCTRSYQTTQRTPVRYATDVKQGSVRCSSTRLRIRYCLQRSTEARRGQFFCLSGRSAKNTLSSGQNPNKDGFCNVHNPVRTSVEPVGAPKGIALRSFGQLHEMGEAKAIFDEPREERTRQFLRAVLEAR